MNQSKIVLNILILKLLNLNAKKTNIYEFKLNRNSKKWIKLIAIKKVN